MLLLLAFSACTITHLPNQPGFTRPVLEASVFLGSLTKQARVSPQGFSEDLLQMSSGLKRCGRQSELRVELFLGRRLFPAAIILLVLHLRERCAGNLLAHDASFKKKSQTILD